MLILGKYSPNPIFKNTHKPPPKVKEKKKKPRIIIKFMKIYN